MKIPIFPGKYHQNGGFSMAMLVYRRVGVLVVFSGEPTRIIWEMVGWAPITLDLCAAKSTNEISFLAVA